MATDEYRGVWVLGEQADGRVQRITHELIARGRALADKRRTDLTAVVLGHDVSEADALDTIRRGADRVVIVEAHALREFLVEPYAACLLWLIQTRKPEILIAGATSAGRTVMPYVAVRAYAGLTADCTVLDVEDGTGNLLQTRPAIGGNILATIKTPAHRPQMATVRPRSTRPAEPDAARQGTVERVIPPADLLRSRIRRVGFVLNTDEHRLQEADAVVVAGRGIRKPENLPLVSRLAEGLDAAVGATRDVVDRGWLSYPHQVGLSGKTITPKLYVGVGVSGAIQHLAGMQTSEHIVAVNQDRDAQIFRVAELGIVGDLFEVLPVLTDRIRRARVGAK